MTGVSGPGGGSGGGPTEEELAAVLAALRVRSAGARPIASGQVLGSGPDVGVDAGVDVGVDAGPLATWRRRRLAVLGQAPRRFPSP